MWIEQEERQSRCIEVWPAGDRTEWWRIRRGLPLVCSDEMAACAPPACELSAMAHIRA
jgi:hypothetical protein